MGTEKGFSPDKIKPVTFLEVKRFSGRAAKERVSIKDSKNTQWYLYDEDRAVIGIYYKKPTVARIKGVWVAPEMRGQGIGTKITELFIDTLLKQGCQIEVYAHNPSFYEQRGFIERSRNQFNVPFLTTEK